MNTTQTNDTYTFWLETDSGERLYWRGLNLRQAKEMYARTDKRTPDNLKRWGWGPTADLRWADKPLTQTN